ncbi:hypothetical protein PR202_gb16300 [Eleusine coracana subsp. coracana]|uniref:Uncharacterized protein n=1 Tax=Eleusine coracana subsp. coracana TaxID=191504 RepID=A0AAV5F007_ELECO|nr:hypothetical protein PR202_gb16300 [Eleusine coracana subsp. coracana]
MLSFKDHVPLDEFVFKTYLFCPQMTSNAFGDIKEPVRYAKTWMQYALMRDVQVLRVLVNARSRSLLLNTPVISQHLRTLELKTVFLDGSSTDLSGCPALEDLKDIFKKDMQLSPIFSKLKTLVLDWWVVASKVRAVIHFLRKAPVLEKISIRLCEVYMCL